MFLNCAFPLERLAFKIEMHQCLKCNTEDKNDSDIIVNNFKTEKFDFTSSHVVFLQYITGMIEVILSQVSAQ
jgi:hypothetical protein